MKDKHPLLLDLLSRTKTNLANYLVSQGRLLCGYNLWDSAIRIDKNPIATMRMASNELDFVDYLYDDGHKYHHYYFAYKLICEGMNDLEKLHQSQKTAYHPNGQLISFKKWFEANFTIEDFEKELNYKEKTKNKSHRQYLEWVAHNKLFLNDLNDIDERDIVFQDIISLPDMRSKVNITLTMNEELIYHSMFDEIKNEYCYARYLVFSSRNDFQKKHYYNQTYPHVYGFNYPIEGLKGNNLKMAFRSLYSIFDKIAYFLNSYYDLNKVDGKIYFHSIFGNYKDGILKPHPKLEKSENLFIHALFYILKDIKDTQTSTELEKDSLYWLEPKTKAITDIRNALEHKSLTISDDFGYELYLKDIKDHESILNEQKKQLETLIQDIRNINIELKKQNLSEAEKEKLTILVEHKKSLATKENELISEKNRKSEMSIVISESEFTDLLFSLFRTIRNSIMYLVLSIEQEERKNKSDDVLYIPRQVPLND